jgi:Cupin domain
VLEGEPEIMTETGRQRLGVGESLIVPPNKPHTFENATEADARVISVYSPPGFERYFLDMGVLVDAPERPRGQKDPQIIERIKSEAARYGMHILPPPDQTTKQRGVEVPTPDGRQRPAVSWFD